MDDSIWDKVHWFNFPDLPTRIVTDDTYFVNRFIPHINNNDGKPYMVYMFNKRINKLYEINHSMEVTEYLNEVGVDFYLNEPICAYVENTEPRYNMLFYSELSGTENPEELRSEELQSIIDYAERNNLTNITVRTCDYGVEKYFSYYAKRLNLIFDDSFVKHTQTLYLNRPIPRTFKKRFMNLNWRWTPHRNLIASFLAPSDNHVSYYFTGTLEDITSSAPWLDTTAMPSAYYNRLLEGMEYINQHSPLNVDLNITETVECNTERYPRGDLKIDDFVDPVIGNPVENKYRDVFCDVVTESRFAQFTGNYSEKTHQPMFYKKPFILVAPPRTLELLHNQGYKTFSEFWDESYDNVENHNDRLIKIFELIELLESKSMAELEEMYEKMQPILEHNHKQLSTSISSFYLSHKL
jgi:hypothetical protein